MVTARPDESGPAPSTVEAETAEKTAEWGRILGYILGNHAAWIIDIGLRTGLLARVGAAGSGGITDERLAAERGFDPQLTATWCRAAYAFWIIDWDEVRGYSLPAPLVAVLLDTTDPQYLGGRVQFYTSLHEDFRAYPDLLQSRERWPRSAHDPSLLTALANLSRPDATMLTTHAIPQATDALRALEAGGSLLEIGSGAGHHLIHYARTYPNAHIEGIEFDLPSVEMARAAVVEAGLADRIVVRHGDANTLDDVERHDLVVMNITLHETGARDDWLNVLQRARSALHPGGSVLVSELPYPDRVVDYRSDAVCQMLAGVQLHESVVGCGMITQGGLRDLLESAGFVSVRTVNQPMKTRHVMLGDR
jgi:SAM-dependent methyltransferase